MMSRSLKTTLGAIALLALLVAANLWQIAHAQQVGTTRETSYDWACCEDQSCTTFTTHQRFDTAFVACVNKSLADGLTRWVQGGRYRVTATPAAPPTASTGETRLSWIPPTTNVDGSALTDLAGYRIRYGTSPSSLTQVLDLDQPGLTAHTVTGLATPGTWYFTLTAYKAGNVESVQTPPVSKTFQ